MDKLEKLLKYVTGLEDLVIADIKEGNDLKNLINVAQGNAFQKVRFLIEDLMNGE